MTVLEIYDPPMCCNTGVCGPKVDAELVNFSAALEWLRKQNVEVKRYNLAQQPAEFAKNETVKAALSEAGDNPLPLVLVNGSVVLRGRYPSREELASLAGIRNSDAPLYTPEVAELVAIGAAVAANCKPCFRHHYDQAVKLGIEADDIQQAIGMAKAVKQAANDDLMRYAERCITELSSPARSS